MSHYRNFRLATYFVAHGAAHAERQQLQKDIDFFQHYLHLDNVYLEPFRDGTFASEEQVRMCKEVFEQNGIHVSGGITTAMPDPEGAEPKQRMFGTLCYNDEAMIRQLEAVAEMNGRLFDQWIIDDFYFTNCTCDRCRAERDQYNAEHGITDGSWEHYRSHKMVEVSRDHMIAPSKRVNPDCKVIIKYPNWMESYQETGYNPLEQKDLFDGIYTGTETRDPVHTDQHLPRYLSFSLLQYFEKLAPGRNGGGWFDPFECRFLDYYLEQAYLTAFGRARELMMFCFQALVNTVNVPALGFMLEKLDEVMDHMGQVVGIPCYIPNGSQGEDNVQDFYGMHGFPIVTTPFFPADAPRMFLTASSACDPEIIDKLDAYLVKGGKAIVTSGFVKATLGRGVERFTSLRDRHRTVAVKDFMVECLRPGYDREILHGSREILIPVLENRNNATWIQQCKGIHEEESYTLLARDTYGRGEMITLCVPESFSDLKYLPVSMLSYMRREFRVNGVYLEGAPMISLFHYDNDSFILYPYLDRETHDTDIFLHVQDGKALTEVVSDKRVEPLYTEAGEAVFRIHAVVGKFRGYHVER